MTQKQTPVLVSIAITASFLSATAEAQDGLGDVRALKPVLMLMVDTSGSMEREAGTEILPPCTGVPANDERHKNRWTGALEALTGSYIDYACERQNRSNLPYVTSDYDYGYYLPHIAPLSTVAQAGDGVLDALRYSTKVGLMTFDGQGTYQGGDPLISFTAATTTYSSLIGNGAETAAGAATAGAAGGLYSYGPVRPLSFPGCQDRYGVNLGARGPQVDPLVRIPGAMVSVPATDSPAALAAANAQVQNSLLSVRPYGGTPIAAVLDDLKYWLDFSRDVRPPPSGTDPFGACRPKYAMLITDGAPDPMFRDSRYNCQPALISDPDIDGLGADRNGNGILEDTEKCGDRSSPLCECPYPLEVATVSSIVRRMPSNAKIAGQLDQLFVVAFNVTDQAAIDALDLIATEGNHGDPTPAITADSAAELRTALNSVFGQVSTAATSRTIPITVDGSAGMFSATAPSYEIRAGFRAAAAPELPWDGILERTVIACAGTAINYKDVNNADNDTFHERLNLQSAANQRVIQTINTAPLTNPRGTLRAAPNSVTFTGALSTTNNLSPDDGTTMAAEPLLPDSTTIAATVAGRNLVSVGQRVGAFDNSINAAFFGDADQVTPLLAGEAGDRQRIVKFLNGTQFPGHALADIYHSNPVALGPVVTAGVPPRLGSWRRQLLAAEGTDGYGDEGSRPMVVFVGTNDGLLHAFNLENWNPGGAPVPAGHEFWSFIPPVLFDKVHASAAPSPTHQFMFDGDIVVKDMYLNGEGSTLANTRTVLLAAVRGAPAYVALDVTTPEQPPRLLWQFSDVLMGDTIAKPVLAQLSFEWTPGVVTERAVAILAGGSGEEIPSLLPADRGPIGDKLRSRAKAPDDARATGRSWKARGRALYVVDVATGLVIQKFDQRHFPAPISGGIAIDETRPVAQSAYFTDEDGVLWHLALNSTKADEWRVEPIWDVFHGVDATAWQHGRPSSYAPTVTRDRAGNTVLLVGTGDIDNLDDAVQHRVVSLTVKRSRSAGVVTARVEDQTGLPTGIGKANWEIVLNASEAVTGPLALLEGTVYFSSFTATATGNDCDLGTSRLWGVHYIDRDPGDPSRPKKELVVADGPPPVFDWSMPTENNAVVLGLSVGKDPLCLMGNARNNPFNTGTGFNATGGPSGSSFHIRANVGSMGGGGIDPGSTSSIGKFNKTMSVRRKSRVVGWAGSVE